MRTLGEIFAWANWVAFLLSLALVILLWPNPNPVTVVIGLTNLVVAVWLTHLLRKD